MSRPDTNNLRPDVASYIFTLEHTNRQLQEQLRKRDDQFTQLENRIADLQQMLLNLQKMQFGRKSEKIAVSLGEQLSMLDSVETEQANVSSTKAEDIEVAAHKRKKRKQSEIIGDIEVVIHPVEIPAEEKKCPRCGNEDLEFIGNEVLYSEYVRVPAHMERHDYVTEKYACHNCEEGTGACEKCDHADTDACKTCPDRPKMVVIGGKLPEELKYPLIKGSKASPSIVGQIYYDEFVQGIPRYRQEKEWERLQFPIPRQTMTNWILDIDGRLIQPLVDYLGKVAKAESTVIHGDETGVKVLKVKTENGNPKKCHMWVIRTGEREKKQIVIFYFRTSREGKEAVDILGGYEKYFVSDGYSGYNELGRSAIRCGCWDHARRYFYNAVPGHDMSVPGTAREGVRLIDILYRIEKENKDASLTDLGHIRDTESRKAVSNFYTWLDTVHPALKGMTDAVNYAKNQKENLMRFLDDPVIPLSNSRAENAIRPFVIGRKNWLFCNSIAGGNAVANAYSIVETAKANDLDVLKYIEYILRRLPIAEGNFTDEFLEKLAPWNHNVKEMCGRGQT